jgi:hypothetical protein
MKQHWLSLLLILALGVGACKSKTENKNNTQEVKNDQNQDKEKDKEKSDKDETKDKSDKSKVKTLEGWEVVPQKSVGKITRLTSYKQLEEIFGAGNLKKSEFCIEGNCMPATKVLEEGKEMVNVVWEDDAQKKVSFIELISPRIKLPNGIHIGTTLGTLERKNGGKAIKFSGFGWDFSGNVTGYSGGALEKMVGDYSIALELEETDSKGKKSSYEGVSGDITLLSTHPKVAKLPISVRNIQVFFNNEKGKEEKKDSKKK